MKDIKGDTGLEALVSSLLADPDWDAFVASVPAGQFEQTGAWAEAKSTEGWRTLRLVLRAEGRILGGAQLLCRPLPLAGRLAFISKGPVLTADPRPGAVPRLIEELKRVLRREHILYLMVQPPDGSPWLEKPLLDAGFRPVAAGPLIGATVRIDLGTGLEDIFGRLARGHRRDIRHGEAGGITVREGGREDIGAFFGLMSESSRRQRSAPNPSSEEFLRLLWDGLPGSGGAFKLFFGDRDGKPLAAHAVLGFNDTAWGWKLGWSGEAPGVPVNQIVCWESIRWAKQAGYRHFDFCGISREAAAGLLAGKALKESARGPDLFKLMFGGEVMLLPGGFAYCPIPGLTPVVEKLVLEGSRRRLHPAMARALRLLTPGRERRPPGR